MDTTEQKLAELERQMGELRALRADRVDTGKAMIGRANRDFDRAAVPLARQINKLREQLDAELEAETPSEPAAPARPRANSHDPEWSQVDIDHYYELLSRGNKKSVKTTR